MTIVSEIYVGIDVSKDRLDVAVLGEKPILQFATTKKGITKLVQHMQQLKSKLIVVEATGGYEEALVLALFARSLPVALVSPQRVRQYAKAKGLLAKTDKLDAQVLAEYGKTMQPRLFVGKSEARRKLAALVGRRKQLNDMLQAEKNRLRTSPVEVKNSLKRVIACLKAEMKEAEEEIHQFMKVYAEFRNQEKLESVQKDGLK